MADEFSYRVQDASLNPAAIALPAGAATTVDGASVDMGTANSDDLNPRLEQFEFDIAIPALDATAMPNTRTLSISIEDSDDDLTFVAIATDILILTGAGGVGTSAASVRYRLKTDARRYIRVSAVTGAGTGSLAASDMTVTLRF